MGVPAGQPLVRVVQQFPTGGNRCQVVRGLEDKAESREVEPLFLEVWLGRERGRRGGSLKNRVKRW